MPPQYTAGQRVRLIRTGELGTILTGHQQTGLCVPEKLPRIQVHWDRGSTRWPLVQVIEPADTPSPRGASCT
ncbi:hypothetical protein ABZ470_39750 [Streptosporangium sp. NPDC020072]|uniref:hypothetical protein n=1 Tax=Streptosporangium sp. NPDC020072 TaxID=3154788 RepID=UPI0034493BDC